MGDPLHSQPVSMIYGPGLREGLIFSATNDGLLHAFDLETGVEEWAFIPPEFLDDQIAALQRRRDVAASTTASTATCALQIVADSDGIIEVRREGLPLLRHAPRRRLLLWPRRQRSASAPQLAVAPRRHAAAGHRPELVDARSDTYQRGGHDAERRQAGARHRRRLRARPGQRRGEHRHDRQLDLHRRLRDRQPALARRQDGHAQELRTLPAKRWTTRSRPTSASSISTATAYADRMYVGDMGGQVWRFDITNGNTAANLIAGGVIAQLGAAPDCRPGASERRRFYYAPDVAVVNSRGYDFMHVGIGSGSREHPLGIAARDRFYAVRDYGFARKTQAQFDSATIITNDLVDADHDDQSDASPQGGAGWRFDLSNGGRGSARRCSPKPARSTTRSSSRPSAGCVGRRLRAAARAPTASTA